MPRGWSVILRQTDYKDRGVIVPGLAVILTDGEEERETARIAFDRERSKNPDVEFTAVLRDELAKAEEAAVAINDLLDEFDHIQAEAVDKAKARVREALGKPPAWNSKPS